MNVTSFKRAVMKQLIKMHKQKGWLGWVPPTPQHPGLEFLLPPQIEAWHKRVVLSVQLPSSVPLILTYHWSPRAACPFSSSSFSPRQTDETQGIISGNGWDDGNVWAHLARRRQEGSTRHLQPHPLLSAFQPPVPFSPSALQPCSS